jgi:pyruvate dehydrogenase E1 component alpha subunit
MTKETGETKEAAAAEEKFSLVSDEALLVLYRRLLESLALEKDARLGGGRMGQKIDRFAAAKVAVWFDLKNEDGIWGAGKPDANGLPGLRDALGTALLNKARKNRKLVLVWGYEDGGGDWQHALEAARTHSLPVVFVCEAGEGKAIRAKLPRTRVVLKPGEELPSITVDGNDVVAAYRVAHEAIERARRDRGPTLILLQTYRVMGRTFANAVEDMENYMRGRGLLGKAREQRSRE